MDGLLQPFHAILRCVGYVPEHLSAMSPGHTLDPRIHPNESLSSMMDCRVEPGNDGAE
jgi:hypothetical protein